MTIEQAQKAGVEAFESGRPSPPALNPSFIRAACISPTETIELLKSYNHGWTIAHLADTAIAPVMPSVIEKDRIHAS